MAVIIGTAAAETLTGGAANDLVIGKAGNDLAILGAGNDVFQWDPGDGNDTVEGGIGVDTLRFTGSADPEIFILQAAAGGRVALSRDVGAVAMDVNDVERFEIKTQGGADLVFVNDLTGTDAKLVVVDLGIGATGDGAADFVFVDGSGGNDSINVGLAGKAVSVTGLSAQVVLARAEAADFLSVSSGDGDDKINASALAASVIQLSVFSGNGNDVITGGFGADSLSGQAGNDVVLGNAGFDTLRGGADNDVLTGGKGDDQVFGDTGDDRMIWNVGDGTDLFEGGDGGDTAEVNGSNASEVFTVTANGTRVRFDGLSPVPFAIDIGTSESLVLKANGGNDKISTTGNLAALIALTIDGGAGNDTILGSNGIDFLLGGDGNDFIDGQQGNDVAFLGTGNDVFQWDPGDGSDIVEGQTGFDTLRFNGNAGAEIFVASANGGRVLFTRNLGNIVMDLDDLERIQLNALGGNDTVTVNDLKGTDAKLVAIDLAGTIGGTTGDGVIDSVIVNATNGNDKISVAAAGGTVFVNGLAAQVTIAHADTTAVADVLVVNGLGGDDTVNLSKLPAGVMALTADGGTGNDTLIGGFGADLMIGGDGNDSVFGDNGNDLALLGAGDDLMVWNHGDGNDVIEGQAGIDTLRFTGFGGAENINITANGGRVLLFRDVDSVTLDMDDVERLEVRPVGGADFIVVGDLSGTDVTEVAIDLVAPDTKIDSVFVNGTAVSETITLSLSGSKIVTGGLPAQVSVDHAGKADLLTVNGGAGDDVINASGLVAGKISLQLLGGLGADVFIGSAGNDSVGGGDGNDTALLGAGNDQFIWNPGDDNDTIEGQDGIDILRFNGANVAENIDISPNGGRVFFFRNIAAVTMDLNDVERIEFNALGGADNIVVNDLSGTDLKQVAIDLAATIGGTTGDAQIDNVVVNATNNNDNIGLGFGGGTVFVNGLATQVTIAHAETIDALTINALAGNDIVNGSKLPANTLRLVLDGGAGNDTLTGGGTNDILRGGDGTDLLGGSVGDDTVTGGAGNDTIAVGLGNDTLVYASVLDGHDFVSKFDGNPLGGQDTLDLDLLFDSLGVLAADRAARVSITDKGATVDVAVDTDGNATFDLIVATLGTADVITVGVGQDVIVGG
jgi:Ca2+-binding RTX toxin-like protein